MKKATLQKRVQIANDIMYYVYTHIDTNIDMEELSEDLKVSKFHMHRIFKEIFSKNIYESIKSIRLQKASNLLLTNRYSTISDVANICGYSSQTSFLRVFKERFGMTPKEWKSGGYKKFSQHIIEQSKKAKKSTAKFDHIEPTIVKMPLIESYYIRHSGYNAQIKQTWQKLQTWIFSNNIKEHKQNYDLNQGLDTTERFNISTPAVKTMKRKFKNLIKLDTEFEIKVKNPSAETGNMQYIERGFDEEKGMSFYKVYFNVEE